MYKKMLIGVAIVLLAGWAGINAQEKSDKDNTVRQKVYDTSKAALVHIHFEFQKDPEEGEPKDHRIMAFITNKMTLDTTGLLIGSEGTVLTTDLLIEKKYVKNIKIIDSTGTEYDAELKGFLQDYPALFLNIKGDKKPAGGIKFAPAGEMNQSRKLFSASLFKDNENWFVKLGPASLALNNPYAASDKTKPWSEIFSSASNPFSSLISMISSFGFGGGFGDELPGGAPVLFDENANVIGYPLEGRIETDGKLYGWRGTDLMENTLITFADFDKKTEDLKKAALNYLVEVKFKFRQKEKDSPASQYDFGSVIRNFRGAQDDEDKGDLNIAEKKLYGLIIDKNRVLIPNTMVQDLIHRIENTEITIGDKTSPAEFMGVFKDFGAMLVKVPDSVISAAAVSDIYKSPMPTHGQIVYAINVKEKFEKRYEKLNCDRFAAVTKGYKNRIQHVPSYSKQIGTFFINQNNNVFGVLMEEKRDLSETLSSSRNYYSYAYNLAAGGQAKTYFFSELKESLITPTAGFDLQLVPLSDREMKRIVCLGVEFQALNKELTEQLGCQKITRNGEMGLLINHIYPESPAEKAGLKTGDILLKIQEEGKDDPIELKGSGNRSPYDYMSRYGGDYDMGGYGVSPWPSRNNNFTQILTRIGAGKKITLTYLRDNQELKNNFVLEKAPYDFDSADKYKDETIGITIKDLTYEVKHHLRLAPDFKAVVISKVEEGSKAAIGKLMSFELLNKINEQPVGSVEEYRKLMEKLIKEEKQTKLRFTIDRKGKSRFVDIELEKPAEAPKNQKEGVPEEVKPDDDTPKEGPKEKEENIEKEPQ